MTSRMNESEAAARARVASEREVIVANAKYDNAGAEVLSVLLDATHMMLVNSYTIKGSQRAALAKRLLGVLLLSNDVEVAGLQRVIEIIPGSSDHAGPELSVALKHVEDWIAGLGAREATRAR